MQHDACFVPENWHARFQFNLAHKVLW